MEKYVLVTGGAGGIGYETARVFAEDGYDIILAGSNEERLSKAREKIAAEFNVSVNTYREDLALPGSALRLFQKIKQDGLTVYILINNAGVGLAGSTTEIDFDMDERMMILNVISLVELCKLFLKEMYRAGEGKILNIASTGAFQPGPYTSTYFASKAFVLNYSKAIRFEAKAKGVQVCTLCPGATRTEFFIREGKETPGNAMAAAKVAQYAYRCLEKDKAVVIPGWKNKILKLAPEIIKMNVVANMKS